MATLIEDIGMLIPILLTLMLVGVFGFGIWLLISLRRSRNAQFSNARNGNAVFARRRQIQNKMSYLRIRGGHPSTQKGHFSGAF
jgi:hypothetical protein